MRQSSVWPNSLWLEGRPIDRHPVVSPGERADVLIVGAGFTGLWTALHLRRLAPALSIMVVDAEQPGFGASGRNGGWCSAFAPMSLDGLAQSASSGAAVAFQRALIDTVSEIGDFTTAHGIDCGWTHAGTLSLARTGPQVNRLRANINEARRHGFGDEFLRMLRPDEVDERVRVPGVRCATHSPACATVDPLALALGIAAVARESGVAVRGDSRFISHRGESGSNVVRLAVAGDEIETECDWLLLCTEGFTARLAGHRRRIAPLYSYMVATEPLPDSVWQRIGWDSRETIADARRLVIYAQRTRDGRIAFGGRGAPYRWASRIDPKHDTDPGVHDRIVSTMFEMFPEARGADVTHRWGGALGVTRDWHTTARVDRTKRTGFAGGYVGDGVALSHLAAAGLARAVLGIDDEIAGLPFVGHRGPDWEPEPLRWLGINGMLRAVALADRLEARTDRPARRLGALIDRLTG